VKKFLDRFAQVAVSGEQSLDELGMGRLLGWQCIPGRFQKPSGARDNEGTIIFV
jgi:hypothetical protein